MPISFGFLAGLGAALSWGTMDVATALASRRLGSLKVTAGIQVVGAVLLVALAFGQGTALPSDPLVLAAAGLARHRRRRCLPVLLHGPAHRPDLAGRAGSLPRTEG